MPHSNLSLLITGGAGFIGSNFIKYMLRKYQDIKITNLDKLTYAGNLKNLIDIGNDKRYAFIKGDITNVELINSLLKKKKFNIIINFAAESHVDRSMINASPFIKTNIVGTLVLLEAIRCNKIDRFIQISTDEVYGSTPDKKKFTEESSLNASSPYSASKASADLICNSYFKSYNVPLIITRSSNNYGPYQFPEKLIPLMIKNAVQGSELPVYGNGLNIRDWLYVEDNCEAIDMIIKNGQIGEIYNIGGNSEKTNIEVVKLICKFIADETGKNEKYFDKLIKFIKNPRGNAHDFRYALNCNKIKRNLGWIPKTDFREGLKKTIKWYINNSDWVKSVTSGEYRDYYNKVYGKRDK